MKQQAPITGEILVAGLSVSGTFEAQNEDHGYSIFCAAFTPHSIEIKNSLQITLDYATGSMGRFTPLWFSQSRLLDGSLIML